MGREARRAAGAARRAWAAEAVEKKTPTKVALADGSQVHLANPLGQGNSSAVYGLIGADGKVTGDVIKIPNSVGSARDLALEVENAHRVEAAGISGVQIKNMPKNGRAPTYLIKERLPDIASLDAAAVRATNGGHYTAAQGASLGSSA